MTGFAWLQFRVQALVAVVALAVVAVVLALTGPHLAHLYDTTVVGCAARGDCQAATSSFLLVDHVLAGWMQVLVLVVPGLFGVFWGAPLVARELETGTWRLVWTQSVTRTRWMVAKLAVAGLATMAATGLLTAMVAWWSSPIDRANANPFGAFDQRGLVPVAYAAFAFALGLAAGVLLRRTLPAMAVTVVVFVAVRLVWIHQFRARLFVPVRRSLPLDLGSTGYGSFNGGPANLIASPPTIPQAWVNWSAIVDRSGHQLSPQQLTAICPHLLASLAPPPGDGNGPTQPVEAPASVQDALQHCVAKVAVHFHEVVAYQPGSRFWALQWTEAGIFLAAAVLLGAGAVWWVRSRLT